MFPRYCLRCSIRFFALRSSTCFSRMSTLTVARFDTTSWGTSFEDLAAAYEVAV